MKLLLMVALFLMLATAAYAAGNPCVRAYIDFDPPNKVHEIYPPAYTIVRAYVCFDCLDLGLVVVQFGLTNPEVTCPGVSGPVSFTSLLPGGLWIGDVFGEGTSLASTECIGMGDYVCAGYLEMFYLGGECCIEIVDHAGGSPGDPWARCVVDCGEPYGSIDHYCILSHGAIGGSVSALCPPGDAPCVCPCTVPAEDSTWGAVKALYR